MLSYRLFLPLLMAWGTNAIAIALPPVPTGPIYYEPGVVGADEQMVSMSCYQLDAAINTLHPYRYSHKPNFYLDGSNQLATGLIIFDSIPLTGGWLGLGYLGYSALVSEKEDRRTLLIEEKIATLQRIKAARHCYE